MFYLFISILLEVIRIIRVICEICGLKKKIRELHYKVEQEGPGNPDSKLGAAVKKHYLSLNKHKSM